MSKVYCIPLLKHIFFLAIPLMWTTQLSSHTSRTRALPLQIINSMLREHMIKVLGRTNWFTYER